MTRRARIALLLALLSVTFAAQAFAVESAKLDLFSAGDHLFESGEKPTAVPNEPGQVLVVGRCEGPGFAIDEVSQVELISPGGRRLALHVEEARIYRDPVADNKIVSLSVYFLAAKSDLTPAAGNFELRWGPGVKAPNKKVAAIVLDPAKRDSYREFRRRKPPPGADGDGQSSALWVIADSKADYYFLWYLMPMALIFVLLTVRKLRGGSSASDDGKASGGPAPRSPG